MADAEIAGGNQRIKARVLKQMQLFGCHPQAAGLEDRCEIVQGNYHKTHFEVLGGVFLSCEPGG